VFRFPVQTRTLLLALSCAIGASVAADDAPRKYVLDFDRNGVVGEQYKLTCSFKSVDTATFAQNAREPFQRHIIASCEGTRTMLAGKTDPGGSKVSFTIARFTYTVDEAPEQSLPAGHVIVAEVKDGKSVLSIDEGNLPEVAVRVLNHFVRATIGNAPSANDQFGSKEPRAVGEQWPVNGAAIAAAFRAAGTNAQKNDVTGSVRLTGLRSVNGIDCFVVEDDYRADNISQQLPMPDRMDSTGDYHERASIVFPTDSATIRVNFSAVTDETARYTWKPGDGRAIPVVQTWHEKFEQNAAPL
jgi:hypothetical protein